MVEFNLGCLLLIYQNNISIEVQKLYWLLFDPVLSQRLCYTARNRPGFTSRAILNISLQELAPLCQMGHFFTDIQKWLLGNFVYSAQYFSSNGLLYWVMHILPGYCLDIHVLMRNSCAHFHKDPPPLVTLAAINGIPKWG